MNRKLEAKIQKKIRNRSDSSPEVWIGFTYPNANSICDIGK